MAVSKKTNKEVKIADKTAEETVVKTAAVVEENEKKAAKEPKKTVEKKATKKTEPKKEAKKTAEKKTTAKKSEAEIILQYGGFEKSTADITAAAKAQFVAEGNKESAIKSFKVYLKPEDGMAYYVVNDDYTGSVSLN